MGLESGTFIGDLVATNPLATDFKSEGDDHLRLIKSVLQGSFPGQVGRAWRTNVRGSGYTAVVNDHMTLHSFATTGTMNFTAAATLGNGWMSIVKNDSTGTLTLDPNGAETINGATTLVLQPGWSCLVWCNGTLFHAVLGRNQPMESLGTNITGNLTLTVADSGLLRRITATATVTLPLISAVVNNTRIILKSTTSGDVLVSRQGSDTIDGGLTSVRLPQYGFAEFTSDGTTWVITRRFSEYVGESRDFGFTATPDGWLPEDGAAVSRTTYAGLFAVIGTNYGIGDGSTTFNVPDSRGRVPVGTGTGTVAETVAAAAVNTGTEAITVASNTDKWITGMKVQLVTTGSLPAPLLAGTDYWVIRLTATTIQLASTLANAQNSTAINLTTQGTGNHTLTHTFLARTIGQAGGEETHALSDTELLQHNHGGSTGNSAQSYLILAGSQVGSASGAQISAAGVHSHSISNAGGNVAANNLQPYVAKARFIKV